MNTRPGSREEMIVAWVRGAAGTDAVGAAGTDAEKAADLLEQMTGVRLDPGVWAGDDRTVAAALHAAKAGARPGAGIPHRDARDAYPMSAAQQQVYLACQRLGPGLHYNMPLALELAGPVDVPRARAAVAALVARHEALRTWFSADIGDDRTPHFWAHVETDVAPPVEVRDLAPTDTPESVIATWARPFDLARAPLMRVLVATREERSLVALDMHHLISDARTAQVLLEEFSALYAGETLPDVRAQYGDWSAWAAGRDLTAAKAFWLGQFPHRPEPGDLVPDFPRSNRAAPAGAVARAHVPGAVRGAVEAFAAASSATPFMVLLAGLMATLARYSRQDDVTIGCPVSGRLHVDVQRTAGLFVNTLALRGHPRRDTTFAALAADVARTCEAAFDNQEYPYEALVEALGARGDASRNPLFDVTLALQDGPAVPDRWAGLPCVRAATGPAPAKFDLSFTVTPAGDGYDIELTYNPALYRAESADRLIRSWLVLLGAGVAAPGTPLAGLPLMDEAERAHVLALAHGPAAGDGPIVPQLALAAAAAGPHHAALVFEDATLTYAEFTARAFAVAAWLRDAGVRPGDLVAVVAGRGFGYPVGAFGALFAGAAFLPIDHAFPAQRVLFELEDSGAKAVLLADTTLAFATSLPTLDLRTPLPPATGFTPVDVGPDDLAYCIYTSGTTGVPKGVLLNHAGLANLARHAATDLRITAADVVCQFASPAFDASVWEMTAALSNGATLVLLPEGTNWDPDETRDVLSRCTVTLLPPHLVPFVRPQGLRVLVTGGAAAEPATVRGASGNAAYVNAYGPTEITVMATVWHHAPAEPVPVHVPIGRPLPGVVTYVLDGDELCPVGQPGELVIGGVGVARGYLNRPDLTAAAFVPDPFGPGRCYRSGDLTRWTPDGDLEYLGRIDEQVKVRGYRVELGEVEATLARVPGVRGAAVVARTGPEDTGVTELVAYVAADEGLDVGRLRSEAARHLPDYMIPGTVIRLDALPVNASGKIDKAALPAPGTPGTPTPEAAPADGSAPARVASPPRTAEEAVVVAAFAEVLDAGIVGTDDSFFALGGDSIKAIHVVSRVREAGYDLTVHDLMEARTPAAIAHALVPSLVPAADQSPLSGVVPLTPIQQAFFAARYPAPGHYNQALALDSREPLDEAALTSALSALCAHHDMLRAHYPGGVQTVRPASEIPLTVLAWRGEADAAARNTAFQAGFDLEAGPLVRAVVYRGDACDHLLLIAHHLVVDAVSWRILAEDLAAAYAQARDGHVPALPPRTASFRDWADALAAYLAEGTVDAEAPAWRRALADVATSDLAGAGPGGPFTPGRARLQLGREPTRELLREAGAAFDAQINDLLLAAFALAVRRSTGHARVCIELESHGRVGLPFPGRGRLALDRTVGWFTCTYPVTLAASDDVGQTIGDVRDALRAVPALGVGYGLLAGRGDFGASPPRLGASPPRPRVTFNYLGDSSGGPAGFSPSALPVGDMIAAANGPGNDVTVTGAVRDGLLGFTIDFDAARIEPEAVDDLCRCFEEALGDVVAAGREAAATGAALGLDDDAMRALGALLGERGD